MALVISQTKRKKIEETKKMGRKETKTKAENVHTKKKINIKNDQQKNQHERLTIPIQQIRKSN